MGKVNGFSRYLPVAMVLLTLGLLGCEMKSGGGAASMPASGAVAQVAGHEYVVGSDASFEPFEYVKSGDQLAGFDVEIMTAVAAKGGFRVRFVNTPWDGIFSLLQQGDVDILASAVTITDERKLSMAFSQPYFASHQLLMVNKHDAGLVGLHALKGQKVAVQTGSTGEDVAERVLGDDGLRRFDSMAMALSVLERGGVAGVVGDNGVLTHYAHVKAAGRFVVLEDKQLQRDEYYGFAVRQGQDALLHQINAGLTAIKADGTYDTIYRKYFGKV